MLTSTRPLMLGSKPAHSAMANSLGTDPLWSAFIRQRHQQARMYCIGWVYRSARLNSRFRQAILHQINEARQAEMSDSTQQYAETVRDRLAHHMANSGRVDYKIVRFRNTHCRGSSGKDPDDKPQQTPDNPHGVRPGQNIEDAERKPLEHFLFGESHEHGSDLRDRNTFDWSHRLRTVRERWAKNMTPNVVGCTPRPGTTSTSAEGSGIDPITNRRVPKQSPTPTSEQASQADSPIEPTFKAYRSRFSRLAVPAAETPASAPRQPIHSNGPPPKEELEKYSKIEIDEIEPSKPASAASLTADSSLPASEEELKKYANVEIDVITDSAHPVDSASPLPSEVTPAKEVYVSAYPRREASPASTEQTVQVEARTVEKPTCDPAELDKYQNAQSYKDAETKSRQLEEPTYEREELAKYRKSWGYKDANAQPAQTACDQAELNGYKRNNGWGYNENVTSPQKVEGSDLTEAELKKYKQGWGYNDSKGKYTQNERPTYDQAELDGYKSKNGWGYDESKCTAVPEEQPVYDREELDGYKGKNGWGYNEPKGTAVSGEQPTCDPAELHKYKRGWGYNVPGGKRAAPNDPVADSLKEYDNHPENEWVNCNLTKSTTPGHLSTPSPKSTERSASHRTDSEDMHIDALRARDVRASMGKSVGQENWNEALEQFESSEPVPKLESALSRHARKLKMTTEELEQVLRDPYSKVPQGLETSFAGENGGLSTLPVIKRTYLSKPKLVHEAQATSSPTVYKILAYDPTMQAINVAETTSTVPDASAALTPPEVLLRLSNPSKFFPHFAPLQAEGFEIVSGSGDVLVFRKVRDAATETKGTDSTTTTAKDEPTASATEPESSTASAVNPIDMTGTPSFSPVSANYASPTGFVNYDMTYLDPLHDKNPPPPPPPPSERFQSGINVRREEPVFSGGRYHYEGNKKSLGKRVLIGAGWVAGVSYALGVVGEYFKTGCADGKGPKGL